MGRHFADTGSSLFRQRFGYSLFESHNIPSFHDLFSLVLCIVLTLQLDCLTYKIGASMRYMPASNDADFKCRKTRDVIAWRGLPL